MSTNGADIGGLYISLGLDASGFTDDFLRAVEGASGPASRLKERIQGLAQSMADLRKETQSVKEQLANAADFRVRGTEGLDKLHEQLSKVRDAGGVTDKTLDQLSLKFEEASRGARTYVQALDRIASDKTAANSTRELARTLADEAREANYAAAQLDKQAAALQRLGSQQARRLASAVNVYRQQEQESVPQRSATSGVVRVASGELSVRAAETFLSGTLGLGSFFEKIFPVAGGLAVLGILDELIGRGNHLYEAYKKFEAEPDAIREAFSRLNNEIATSNDELRVTNDRLANDLAALQGQPQNRLALMLDEARVAADKLADSLQKDLDKLQKTFNDNNISGWERLLGNATDSGQVEKELFGKNEHGGLRRDVQDLTARYQKEIRRLADEEATAPPEQKQQLLTQQNTVRSNATRDIGNRFQAEIDALQKRLEHEQQLQQQYERYRSGNPELRLAAITQEQQTGHAPEFTYDQTRLIQRDTKIIDTLKDLRESSLEQFKSIELTQAKDITPDLRPYQDKLRELAAQFNGLKSQLASIGGTETAKTLAKSWTDAQEAITKLNNEFINKDQPALNAAQQAAIIAAEDKNAQIKGEVEWKEKVQQTTTSINERIESLKRLTSAIGEGYEAQKRAFVENEVAKFTAPFANDPDTLKRRQGDIEAVRQKATGQFEAQQANAIKTDLDKLNTQVELETRLANVESQGAEAVRQATLAFQAEEAAKNHDATASANLLEAERKLSDAQAQRKANEFLAQLQREIDATNRLAAAQSSGADAIRRAQLENRLAEVLPGIPEAQRPAVEKKLRQDSAAQEQLQIAQQAESTAQAYQRQLDAIDQQIRYLQQKKSLGQDIANDEIGIQKLEEERTKIYAQQVAVLGSARDGMRAFFQELATDGVSAAAQVHDALSKTFDSLNDSLAKLVAGQKVSWSSFFSGISEQLTKNSLRNLESRLAGALTQPGQTGKEQGEHPHGFLGRIEHFFSGLAHPPASANPAVTHPTVHEQIGTPESPLSKIGGSRDGQSAASALFVTTVDAGTSANPAPSSAALPPPGTVSSPTTNPLAALGETLPTPPPYRQAPGQLSLPEAIAREEGFGANPNNIPTRLNNPGDIEFGPFAQKYGATADQSGFARFPSVDAGKQAELDLLNSPGYANLPLSQAIPRYNGTNQPNNAAYLRAVTQMTGLSPDTLVREAMQVSASSGNGALTGGLGIAGLGLSVLSAFEQRHRQNQAIRRPSPAATSQAQETVPAHPQNASFIPNGSEYRLPITTAEDAAVRAQFRVPPEAQFIGSTGRGDYEYYSGSLPARPAPHESVTSRFLPVSPEDNALSIADLANLGDFGNSELAQLKFGGFRAAGGTVHSDKVHVVGENGPELFVPDVDGTIVPNHKLASFAAMMSGTDKTTDNRTKLLAQLAHFSSNAFSDGNFGGFRADGGDVDAGDGHVVGENGRELFLPITANALKELADAFNSTGSDSKQKQGAADSPDKITFQGMQSDAAALSLADLSDLQRQPAPPATNDSSAVLNQQALENEQANLRDAQQDQRPAAFDKTRSNTKLLNVSLPTKPAGNQWGDFLEIAGTVAKGLAAGAAGADGEGASGAAGGGGGILGTFKSLFSTKYETTGGGGGAYGPDISATGGGGNSGVLGDAGLTIEDLGRDSLNESPGNLSVSKWNRFGKQLTGLGITAGLGVLSQFLQNRNTPDPHHFKPGSPYYIPDFNAALAKGGEAKAGMTHLVGERGPEMFVPSSLSKLAAHSTDHAVRLPAAVGMRDTMPFGGYRATGGSVDPSQSFMVGENGPELFTPPTSGNIVPNSAMHGGGVTNQYIDARGTDPAQSSQNFQRVMQKTSQHSIKQSFRSVHEFQMRSPRRSGSQAGWS